MKEFRAIVHQTDERMLYLDLLLKDVRLNKPTHIFAPNVVVKAATLTQVEDGAKVYLGKCLDEAKMLANSRDITIVDYSKDEHFQAVNARLTAEGALKEIIEHTVKSISDCIMLILGFGRTGAAMARLLNRLDVTFDVATNASSRPSHAFARKAIPLCDFNLIQYDVIINTVPSPIISDKELTFAKQGCVYIELASTPAINMDFARHIGMDAEIYPALPAKTCPYSAAKAMFDYISEAEK